MSKIRRHRPFTDGCQGVSDKISQHRSRLRRACPSLPPGGHLELQTGTNKCTFGILFCSFFRSFFPIFFWTYPSSHLGAPVVPLWILWAVSDDFGLPFWMPFLVIDLFSASFFQVSILDRFSMGFASIFTCLEPRFLLENKQFRDFSSFLKKHEKSMISVTSLASFSHPFGILFTSFSVPILV